MSHSCHVCGKIFRKELTKNVHLLMYHQFLAPKCETGMSNDDYTRDLLKIQIRQLCLENYYRMDYREIAIKLKRLQMFGDFKIEYFTCKPYLIKEINHILQTDKTLINYSEFIKSEDERMSSIYKLDRISERDMKKFSSH